MAGNTIKGGGAFQTGSVTFPAEHLTWAGQASFPSTAPLPLTCSPSTPAGTSTPDGLSVVGTPPLRTRCPLPAAAMGAIKVLLLTAIVAVLSFATIASALPTDGGAEVGLPDDAADGGPVEVNWPTAVDDDEPEEAAPALSRSTSADGPGLAQIMRQRKVCRYRRCGVKPTKVVARVEYPCYFRRSRKLFTASKRTCNTKPFDCKRSPCKRWKVCKCTWKGGLGRRRAWQSGAASNRRWRDCVSPVARVKMQTRDEARVAAARRAATDGCGALVRSPLFSFFSRGVRPPLLSSAGLRCKTIIIRVRKWCIKRTV